MTKKNSLSLSLFCDKWIKLLFCVYDSDHLLWVQVTFFAYHSTKYLFTFFLMFSLLISTINHYYYF